MHTSQITPTPTPCSKFPFFINYFKINITVHYTWVIKMHDRWTVRNLSGKSLYEEGHGKSCSTEPWTQLQYYYLHLFALGNWFHQPCCFAIFLPLFQPHHLKVVLTHLHVDLISSIVSETGVSGVTGVSVVCGFSLSAILENSFSVLLISNAFFTFQICTATYWTNNALTSIWCYLWRIRADWLFKIFPYLH